ncbi:Oidioi.mRNA.OKI2018_I69.PAR.g11538.t1.cds [Oikopleura dioica]|uniref:Oidioi.mRNA.OKI2018_I69.PAR.g11538.t1.cds n=1 Tax=Oikopleura dioica TaxID=34765 RepID=A0ABN7S094_OIKDI|nr:Oidioi.mRNA.OKI2018_I69.PAR.g11538.t1.cds [Oikopleura dioica]
MDPYFELIHISSKTLDETPQNSRFDASDILKKRYLDVTTECLGLGNSLCHSRFGNVFQLMCKQVNESCVNPRAVEIIRPIASVLPMVGSLYIESSEKVDLIPWHQIGGFFVEFTTAPLTGIIIPKKIHVWIQLIDGSWDLIDMCDNSLGNPFTVLKAACSVGPRIACPWPTRADPLGEEKASLLLLMGFLPSPTPPKFCERLRQLLTQMDSRFLFDRAPTDLSRHQSVCIDRQLETFLWRAIQLSSKKTTPRSEVLDSCARLMNCNDRLEGFDKFMIGIRLRLNDCKPKCITTITALNPIVDPTDAYIKHIIKQTFTENGFLMGLFGAQQMDKDIATWSGWQKFNINRQSQSQEFADCLSKRKFFLYF